LETTRFDDSALKNPFDSVPISVATHLKSESSSLQCSLEVFRAIHENDGGFDTVFAKSVGGFL